MRMQLKYHSENTDFRRTYYVNKTGDLYCRQEDYNNVFNWYFCTEEGEPLSEVKDTHIDIVKEFGSKPMNHTITLSSIDIGHILDGLRCRAEAWKNTLDYLESETTTFEPDGLIEECNDAGEAQQIADHYNSIIETIEKQIGK